MLREMILKVLLQTNNNKPFNKAKPKVLPYLIFFQTLNKLLKNQCSVKNQSNVLTIYSMGCLHTLKPMRS